MKVFCVHLVLDLPQTGASGVVRHGRRHGPSITYKITPCWVLFSSQPGGPPCWTSPLAFTYRLTVYCTVLYCVLYVGVDFDGLMEMAEGFTLG
jgi:hypothetical protein